MKKILSLFILLSIIMEVSVAKIPIVEPFFSLPLDNGEKKDPVEFDRTGILVLATFHLAQLGDRFQISLLDSIVDKLLLFKPAAIAVESLPGDVISVMETRQKDSPLFQEILETFAETHLSLGHKAQALLGMDRIQAASEVERYVQIGTPPDRLKTILTMLAAYDLHSAVLQWTYLSPTDKKDQVIIPTELAVALDAQSQRINEITVLAGRLARRLGLQRLYPVDEFEDLDAMARILPALQREITKNPLLKSVGSLPVYSESQKSLERALSGRDLLPHYLFLNSPEYAADDVDAQWGVFLRTGFSGGEDRGRLALWENRNLKIAARIRTVSASYPGQNILVIYGAAHRPFLEAYLGRMMDVDIVKFDELINSLIP